MSPFDSNRAKSRSVSALDLAAAFLDVIPPAMREVRKELRSHRGDNLTVPQFRIFAAVFRETKTNKELAEHIGVDVGTMSRMVQTLVDQDLVEKSPSPEDGRVLRIQLSKEGRNIFEKIRAHARHGIASHLTALSSADRETVMNGLAVLSRSLKGGDWVKDK